MKTNAKILMPKLDFNKLKINGLDEPAKHFNTSIARELTRGGLDYTFKFHKEKLQSNDIDRAKLEDYVYDLENTWVLNRDMMCNIAQDNEEFNNDQKKHLSTIFKKIQDNFNKKKALRQSKMRMKGKILMDKQVLEEYKRRNEENHLYYEEQLTEYTESMEKKESFIKQFEKKFSEVEIYIQREARNSKEKFDNFVNFEILSFISLNESMHKKIITFLEEVKSIREDIKSILKENVELKKRDELIENSEENETAIMKYKELTRLYSSKIKFLERNREHLKNALKCLTCKLVNVSPKKYPQFKIKAANDISIKLQDTFDLLLIDKKNANEIASQSKKCRTKRANEEAMCSEEGNKNMSMNAKLRHLCEEIKSEDEEDRHNKSMMIGTEEKKEIGEVGGTTENYSYIIETNPMKASEFQKNKIREGWDISCIEQND